VCNTKNDDPFPSLLRSVTSRYKALLSSRYNALRCNVSPAALQQYTGKEVGLIQLHCSFLWSEKIISGLDGTQ
jgi:hypothetical protein